MKCARKSCENEATVLRGLLDYCVECAPIVAANREVLIRRWAR